MRLSLKIYFILLKKVPSNYVFRQILGNSEEIYFVLQCTSLVLVHYVKEAI